MDILREPLAKNICWAAHETKPIAREYHFLGKAMIFHFWDQCNVIDFELFKHDGAVDD